MKYVKKYEELDFSKFNPFKSKEKEKSKEEKIDDKLDEIKSKIDGHIDYFTIKFDKTHDFSSRFDSYKIEGIEIDGKEISCDLYFSESLGSISMSINFEIKYEGSGEYKKGSYDLGKINNFDVKMSIYNISDYIKFRISDRSTKINIDDKNPLFLDIYVEQIVDKIDDKIRKLNSTLPKIKKAINDIKLKEKRLEAFNKQSEDILDMFYDIIDMCDKHEVRFQEDEAIYIYTFYLKFDYSKNDFFKLSKNLADFFTYLHEAKLRIRNMVMPEAEFNLKIEENKITLVIK
jgi:hypothetical protein